MGISTFPAVTGPIRKSQTFVSSGTFTLPSGYGASKPLLVDLEVCGGGGGGGGGAANAAACGGGGGGGSGICTVFERVSLTANATITIGAGGTGGAAVSPTTTGNNGTSGGASDVDSIYYSPGGAGGGGGRSGSGALYGLGINSYGYVIGAQYIAAGDRGIGGAGGSGGAISNLNSTNPSAIGFARGGCYGFPGNTAASSPTSGSPNGIDYTVGDGFGLAFNGADMNAAASQIITLAPMLLQRGAGGGGGRATTTPRFGTGGDAGTRNSGGLSGLAQQTTGTKTGGSATDNGCGGGGGGAGYDVASGAGGNGAAGYVTIYWWE